MIPRDSVSRALMMGAPVGWPVARYLEIGGRGGCPRPGICIGCMALWAWGPKLLASSATLRAESHPPQPFRQTRT
jgi:hypothetical protein